MQNQGQKLSRRKEKENKKQRIKTSQTLGTFIKQLQAFGLQS